MQRQFFPRYACASMTPHRCHCLQIIISDPSTGQKVATLEGHESYVKGLAWDPVRCPVIGTGWSLLPCAA